MAFAANQLIAKDIRIFFYILPNLPTETLFNVLPLFEMWNSSAAIIIQMQRGCKGFVLFSPAGITLCSVFVQHRHGWVQDGAA